MMPSTLKRIWTGTALFSLLFLSLSLTSAFAEYNRIADSAIDLNLFSIDEPEFLGTKINTKYGMVDGSGKDFNIFEYRNGVTVMVLSYYKCDGVCSAVNSDLKELLKGVKRVKMGEDFRVLTTSFDKYDSLETLAMFKKGLKLSKGMEKDWRFSIAKDPEAIKDFTDSFGFKYFWSPRDKTFFHPNVYLVLSPVGRISRYLYANTISSRDLELAIMEAGLEKSRPNQIINIAIGYCYSYNYKEGKYSLNIPLFVALGSLTFGITAFVVSAVVFKRNNKNA